MIEYPLLMHNRIHKTTSTLLTEAVFSSKTHESNESCIFRPWIAPELPILFYQIELAHEKIFRQTALIDFNTLSLTLNWQLRKDAAPLCPPSTAAQPVGHWFSDGLFHSNEFPSQRQSSKWTPRDCLMPVHILPRSACWNWIPRKIISPTWSIHTWCIPPRTIQFSVDVPVTPHWMVMLGKFRSSDTYKGALSLFPVAVSAAVPKEKVVPGQITNLAGFVWLADDNNFRSSWSTFHSLYPRTLLSLLSTTLPGHSVGCGCAPAFWKKFARNQRYNKEVANGWSLEADDNTVIFIISFDESNATLLAIFQSSRSFCHCW